MTTTERFTRAERIYVDVVGGRRIEADGTVWDTRRRGPDGRALWESEDDLLGAIAYDYTDGNGGCDCNKAADHPCGDALATVRVTVTLNDGREVVVWEAGS